MKKIAVVFLYFFAFMVVKAQDCLEMFPPVQGTVLVNKTYDANNNLLHTITYTVTEAYDYVSGSNTNIDVTIMDNNNTMISTGELLASCENGMFYMQMKSRGDLSEMMDILSTDTKLIGDFLDYPNTFSNNYPFDYTFQMNDGEFSVESENESMNVRIFDRDYEKNETITTPAGDYLASKVTLNFEVRRNDEIIRYKGVEWYALNAGVIRTETYDMNDNLVNYSVLSSLR